MTKEQIIKTYKQLWKEAEKANKSLKDEVKAKDEWIDIAGKLNKDQNKEIDKLKKEIKHLSIIKETNKSLNQQLTELKKENIDLKDDIKDYVEELKKKNRRK